MSKRRFSQRHLNLLLAGTASLVGFVSLIITFGSLLFGFWLDARFGTGKTWTVVCIVMSVPVSLVTMLFMALGLVRRIVPQPPQRKSKNEEDSFEAN
jgi:hypothetical protein